MSDALRITFLGTGTSMGVPVIGCPCEVCQSVDPHDNRLRSSVLIQKGDSNIIIDSGPDFRYQALRAGVRSLSALVFTHEHKDHTAGMDDVRAFNFIQRKPVEVYASTAVEKALRNEFHYAFTDIKYPGVPEIRINNIAANATFEIEGLLFEPIQVYHHKLPVLGFRIGDFTYITDANSIAEEEIEKVRGTKVLVLNALRRQTHISHFTLDEALRLIEEIKPEQAYLTHISHQMGTHADVSKELPSNVAIAYDQLQIEL
jgi:phosphoribosyl 1,2-cyclic phosphate phosphodiesterase